ncbi:hypothetical protein COEREDRAFT_49789 [Coemansia reversa NRRL 1564]|uniref:Exonuclease domain-containing protein n=1 Tax=Coemansia reversa (strain ATCC 12441 / NRRL 1564) TaxID=763665 RepID=A0A2G5B2B1_COERN|nr:hypothetical protein COEREDRAFT_49789 [Coemansia reversa NRRL 1564]|eukprot:PIA13146.1 hypothetical protein COEREDRAFT_49789 [Coemansia reversa NRRL 1564]
MSHVPDYEEKYREKLLRRAREEGVETVGELRQKIKKETHSQQQQQTDRSLSNLSAASTAATATTQPLKKAPLTKNADSGKRRLDRNSHQSANNLPSSTKSLSQIMRMDLLEDKSAEDTGSPASKPATVVAGSASGGKVPKHMQQMRIAYSRFGVEDFDFSLYNSTRWSGLEGNISNAYANALLQLLFFSSEFRALMLSHCAGNCPEPNCLSCQLGLLFRMLASADGASCHATLLLRVLSERPEATALALLEELNGNTAAAAGATSAPLVALVSSIRDVRRGPEHLIVHVRDPENSATWLLFNDFLVQPVAEDSVVGLYDWWREPSIAIYANTQRQQLKEVVDAVCHQHPYKISSKILTTPRSNNNNARMRNRAVPLSKAEAGLLERGEFKCALDAEFVVLEEAKMEVFSDGTRSLHRPPMHALARLSAVRANEGDLHGVPFIDDYVAISRPIADLATLYSGIHAGDLTVGISPYRLSTMKEVYKKLRLLVDSKCVFIGHGLKHDFRVCNISVPIALQRDTMLLFQSPSHIRPISLRFLYWYFYRKSIQTREHSSVEDAQATLKVYESYCKCIDGGPDDAIESVLDAIYTVGANMSWKLPDQKF